MAENLFSTFAISGQGMSVERMRLAAVAKNIANANTTKGPDGQPYKREVVIAADKENKSFGDELDSQISLTKTSPEHSGNIIENPGSASADVISAYTAKDNTPPRLIYDPSHPDADKDGYVKMPNINIVTEMVEMISAQRAFEANASVVESAKNMARDSLDI